jgi:hypothetical protein
VPTGEASGLDVFDIDAPRHPEAASWFAARRDALPRTRVHRTRSGGLHVLFRHRPGMRCWSGRPIPGIDGRADAGYAVWWPAAGFAVLCDAPVALWPEWLVAELAPPEPPRHLSAPLTLDPIHGSRYCAAALRDAARRIATAPIGARNSVLNAEAFGIGRLIAARGLSAQEAADTLAAAAVAAGLAPREVEATLRSAFGARGVA